MFLAFIASIGATSLAPSQSPQDASTVGQQALQMDVFGVLTSLILVLVIIGVCAYILKRLNLVTGKAEGIKVISNVSLGAKERLIVVQVNDEQLLLGVTNQQITLIEKLSKPLPESSAMPQDLSQSVLSFIKKKS